MKKEYRGYLIIQDSFDTYYLELSKIINWKEYEFKRPYLVETTSLNNRKVIKMQRYLGNNNIEDAIDIYYIYKDLRIPEQPSSIVFDFWFNILKRDVSSFKKTFKTNNLNETFLNIEKCLEWWNEFKKLDNEMNLFLNDNKIKDFFKIQEITNLINLAKNKQFDLLV